MAYGISFGSFFDSFNPSTIILGILFIFLFAIFNMAAKKTLPKNPGVAGVSAFCISTLAIYGIHLTNFNFNNLINNIGIDSEIITPILAGILLVAFILLLKKFGFGKFLLTIGAIFLIISFFAYEKAVSLTIGIIFTIFGLLFLFKKSKKKII